MFQQILIAAAIKAIMAALCQIYGFCLDQDECPDGVCDEAIKAIESLDEAPQPTVTKPMAFDFDIQWDKLQPLVAATVELINALKAFLGLNKVG
jgi:hypothetical protein